MDCIIYWSGDKYALTSALLPVEPIALEDKQLLSQLDGIGLVVTVRNSGVIPVVDQSKATGQIVSTNLEELLELCPSDATVHVVDQYGNVVIYLPGEEDPITLEEYYEV